MSAVIQGLADFEGETLAVFLAGLDCGNFPVIDAQITVPTDGSLSTINPDGTKSVGLMTDHYLAQVSALGRNWGVNTAILSGGLSVPCVVGYRYKSQGQTLRPVSSADTGAAAGPGFGKYKRVHEYAVLLTNAQGIRFGDDLTHPERMHPFIARTPGEIKLSPGELFTGVWTETLDSDVWYDGNICWEVDGPYSATVNNIGGFVVTEDR